MWSKFSPVKFFDKLYVSFQKKSSVKVRCGLCGTTKQPLTKTDCCGKWVCDYVHVYGEYARNSCYRNHDRYTLCAYHHHENHAGLWQDCKKCKDNFDMSDYVSMSANEYNFDILKKP